LLRYTFGGYLSTGRKQENKDLMQERVRRNTSEKVNREIAGKTKENIRRYSSLNADAITARINELDREWDIERVLEVNMSSLALTGIALTIFHNRRWLILPSVVLGFFLQHATQGWCPPLPLLRRLGFRTRNEIEQEKYALKVLRGDFKDESAYSGSNPSKLYNDIKK
jgi:hypothetical protein